jgi:hypothetical protein
MSAGEFVGAICRDDHHRSISEGAGQEAKQMTSRLVSPVDVLHDHHERPVLAGSLQQDGDSLEKLQPDRVIVLTGRCTYVGQKGAKRLPAGSDPFQDLLAAMLIFQIPQCANDRRVRQAFLTHRHALSPDQLGLAVGERSEQIRDERLHDRGLAGASVTADDHKPATVVDHLIESLAKLSTLFSPADDVLRPQRSGRSGRFHHEHYRATSLLTASRTALSARPDAGALRWRCVVVRGGTTLCATS